MANVLQQSDTQAVTELGEEHCFHLSTLFLRGHFRQIARLNGCEEKRKLPNSWKPTLESLVVVIKFKVFLLCSKIWNDPVHLYLGSFNQKLNHCPKRRLLSDLATFDSSGQPSNALQKLSAIEQVRGREKMLFVLQLFETKQTVVTPPVLFAALFGIFQNLTS